MIHKVDNNKAFFQANSAEASRAPINVQFPQGSVQKGAELTGRSVTQLDSSRVTDIFLRSAFVNAL